MLLSVLHKQSSRIDLSNNTFWPFWLSTVTGKAFDPGYVKRIVRLLGFIVLGDEAIHQKVAKRGLKMALGCKRFKSEERYFESANEKIFKCYIYIYIFCVKSYMKDRLKFKERNLFPIGKFIILISL